MPILREVVEEAANELPDHRPGRRNPKLSDVWKQATAYLQDARYEKRRNRPRFLMPMLRDAQDPPRSAATVSAASIWLKLRCKQPALRESLPQGSGSAPQGARTA